MTNKEYIVALKSGIDYSAFWAEMESKTSGLACIPDREIEVADYRAPMKRLRHYLLSDSEATQLRTDERVLAVDIPVSQNPLKRLTPHLTASAQMSDFVRPVSAVTASDAVNWGLIRNSYTNNVYGSVSGSADVIPPHGLSYDYYYDGTGVDIVIMDTGIQPDHPEFLDINGNSRVQQIDWYAASGGVITGTQDPNFYQDLDGHGTHVAGIAAGRTFGWAKNANIYMIKVDVGQPDANIALDVTKALDLVTAWHQNKTTGYPTVVNMSFGESVDPYALEHVIGGSYRGTTWTGSLNQSQLDPAKGFISDSNGNFAYGEGIPSRTTADDVAVDEMIGAGIVVIRSAGNQGWKIDSPSGVDYGNYFISEDIPGGGTFTWHYYHQGASPTSNNAIIVGALDSITHQGSSTVEQKTDFSNAGPGVTLFSAGQYISSTVSNVDVVSNGTSTPYYNNADYRQAILSGTSMASPQVAGIAALYLQINPGTPPTDVRNWLLSSAGGTLYNSGKSNDYTTSTSQWGGTAKIASAAGLTPSYTCAANIATVNLSNNTVRFSITTTNVSDGSILYWTITPDPTASFQYFTDGVYSGAIPVVGGTTYFDRVVTNDLLKSNIASFNATISYDTSGTTNVYTTSAVSVATPYSISQNKTAISEGDGTGVTFTITTAGVPDGTKLYWQTVGSSGITSARFTDNHLSGNVTVNSNTASLNRTAVADNLTEGATSFYITISTDLAGTNIILTGQPVTIADTSMALITVPGIVASPTLPSRATDSAINLGTATTGVGAITIKSGSTWKPVKNLSYKTSATTWSPVKTAWYKRNDGTWEQIYPTPSGIGTVSSSTLSFNPYVNYYDAYQRVSVSNTGNAPLVISQIVSNDASNYTSSVNTTGLNSGGFPLTIQPGGNAYMDVTVFGNSVGSGTGNIILVGTTAGGASANTTINVSTQVQSDYAGISVTPSPLILTSYLNEFTANGNITIYNTGIGAPLYISSIFTANGSAVSVANVGYGSGYTIYNVSAPAGLAAGTYYDTITITSNAPNAPVLPVPVQTTVIDPHGTQTFTTVGADSFTVPSHIYSINVSYPTPTGLVTTALAVTPGQVIPVQIGDFQQSSTFGNITAPAFDVQVFHHDGNVDADLTMTIACAGDQYFAITYEGWHGTLGKNLTFNPVSSNVILNNVRVVLASATGRCIGTPDGGVGPQSQVPVAQGNSLVFSVYLGDGYNGEGYYTDNWNLQQQVPFVITW